MQFMKVGTFPLIAMDIVVGNICKLNMVAQSPDNANRNIGYYEY